MSETAVTFQDSLLLLDTSSRSYIPFVELGVTSDYYHHDMYHLLASRTIASLESLSGLGSDSLINARIEGIYRHMMDSYRRTDNPDALLLTNLDYLQWKRRTDPGFRPYHAPEGRIGLTQDPYFPVSGSGGSSVLAFPAVTPAYLLPDCNCVMRPFPAIRLITVLMP